MCNDWDKVSKEDHELEYILKKYDKRTTKENKKILCDIIDSFKSDDEYSPYYHKDLYRYLDDNPDELDSLENS